MGISNGGTLQLIGPPQNILHFLREGFTNITREDYVYHKEEDTYELLKQADLACMKFMWTKEGSHGETKLENYQPRHDRPALIYKKGSRVLHVNVEGRGHLQDHDFSQLVRMTETFGLSMRADFYDEEMSYVTMEADSGKALLLHESRGCWDSDCKGNCPKCKRESADADLGFFRSIS
ncbi:hypothetical protein IMZ31_18985 (plasmid) [Pontibacillus sp. ALD_SL1]|uniref:hypothetical protein n=1 Tax=Pontibacillus sp. ALD_SL1 TaxID=2777185 RepID=UPI001A97D2DF|nr:hypothetical protein [Pontibacillus sp. ALD_SL1]QST02635.1 hypothetical protein IMZ31_18985 [Pontibacillus sp. ALD_SL1]